MSDAILRQISADVRETRGDVKLLLGTVGNHEARINALEKAEEKEGWMRRWFDILLEAPRLIHICILAGTLFTSLWWMTHGWLVGKVESESRHRVQPNVAYAENRIPKHVH